MATGRSAERRLLDVQELALIDRTHHPVLGEVGDEELGQLITNVRERRDRARDIANRQRRQIRGKAAGGSGYDKADQGNRQKQGVLAQALQRLNKERKRRSTKSSRGNLVDNARRALELKKSAPKPKRPASRTANKGMSANPNERAEDIGSPMEAGRVSQSVKNAQARRDSSD
jgi:hypothetical protein